jgi:hypothetical protein
MQICRRKIKSYREALRAFPLAASLHAAATTDDYKAIIRQPAT